jgi:hypothetical protein
MPPQPSSGPLACLPPELFALIEGPSILHLATRNAALEPTITLAFGIRLAAGGPANELSVFVPTVLAAATLANLRDNGQMAVTLVSPPDSRSAQLKGLWLGERRTDETDRAHLERHDEELTQVMGLVGVPRSTWRRLRWWPAVALRMEVRDVFVQTPGPAAGRRCDGAASGASGTTGAGR